MSSQNQTYYEILGVSEDASFEDIRAAFRQRAREFHPDVNKSPDAVDRMQEVNEAYEVLRDEEQRAAYDRMHRYFNVSEADFNRASDVAITAVGELAFDLGWGIGARQNNEWTRAGIGGERTPDGLWPAAFEAALEAALERDQADSPQTAARQAAWVGAQSDAARQARLHTLRERASSPTEAHATRLSVEIVGMLASAMGHQLGRMRSSERPHPRAWIDAYLAAHEGVLRGLMRHMARVTYLGGVTQAIFDSIVSEAVSSAQSAVRPYVEQMRVGRRMGRGERVGGSEDRLAESAGQGCAIAIIPLIGILAISSVIWLLVGWCNSVQYDAIEDMQPVIVSKLTPMISLHVTLLVRSRCSECLGLRGIIQVHLKLTAWSKDDARYPQIG